MHVAIRPTGWEVGLDQVAPFVLKPDPRGMTRGNRLNDGGIKARCVDF